MGGVFFLRDESNLASEGKCKLNDMAAVYFLLLFSAILFYFYFLTNAANLPSVRFNYNRKRKRIINILNVKKQKKNIRGQL